MEATSRRSSPTTSCGPPVEWVFVGTHTGEFAGVPATGVPVSLPYSMSYDISVGKIAAIRAYFPMMVLVQQLRDAAVAQTQTMA